MEEQRFLILLDIFVCEQLYSNIVVTNNLLFLETLICNFNNNLSD